MAKKSGSQYKIYPPCSRVLRPGIAVCFQGGVENGDKGDRRPRRRRLKEFCMVEGHDMIDRTFARVKIFAFLSYGIPNTCIGQLLAHTAEYPTQPSFSIAPSQFMLYFALSTAL